MNIFEFIIMLLLIIISVAAAFLVGFGIGDRDPLKAERPQKPAKHRKAKPPDKEEEPDKKLTELKRIAAEIEKYDGGAGNVR